jgi:DNA polymerase-4
MGILRDITPLVEQISIDEAFLDVSGSLRRLGEPRAIGEMIRAEVAERFQITCSVGIAASKSVAKIAGAQVKPDGLLEVPPEQTLAFLRPLPIGALWGAGAKTRASLERLGIRTVGELADARDGAVVRAIGEAAATHLLRLARGQDTAPVHPGRDEKSIGAEVTFDHDLPAGPALRRELLGVVERSAHRLRARSLMCRTVGVKVRTSDFTTVTRSKTLPGPTDATKEILETASALVQSVDLRGLPVRLLGVRLENVVRRSGQPIQATFDQVETTAKSADRAADAVRLRFGEGSLGPGTLI